MCSVNSNCSRIDAVKASANQIKLQKLQADSSRNTKNASDVEARSVRSGLEALDASIKSGDAQKAELALSSVRAGLSKLDTNPAVEPVAESSEAGGGGLRQFLAYA